MDRERALEITIDRLGVLRGFVPKNKSEKKIAEETIDYLQFVRKMLEG